MEYSKIRVSIQELMASLGLSRSTVKRDLEKLEKLGLVHRPKGQTTYLFHNIIDP